MMMHKAAPNYSILLGMGVLLKLGSFWNTEQRNLLAVFGVCIEMLDTDNGHDYEHAKAPPSLAICPRAAGRRRGV